MTYIFVIACFNAFFFLGLLVHKKPKALHDKILIYWLCYLGVSVGLYGFTMNMFAEAPILTTGVISTFLLHGPFMYLYVSDMTSDAKPFAKKKLLHFAPFVLFVFYLVISSMFPEYSRGISVDHSPDLPAPPFLFVLFLIATAVSGPIYFVLAFNKYRKLKQSSENFSARDINLEWLGKLITTFGVVWTIFIIIAVIHHVFHLFSMMFCTNGLFLSLSGFIILIGYYGLNQREVFVSYEDYVDNKKTTSTSIPSELNDTKNDEDNNEAVDSEYEKCFNLISSYMDEKQPYLDPDITLPKLADQLEVPAHQLSQVINEIYKRNFFDFINNYRVEEVKRKIKDEEFKNYSLLAIAFDSGFNSKSAFNRVFKKMTTMTPSQYRNSLIV